MDCDTPQMRNLKTRFCYHLITLWMLVTSAEARVWNNSYKLPDYDNPTLVAKNQLLTTIPEMGNEWTLKFEFMNTVKEHKKFRFNLCSHL